MALPYTPVETILTVDENEVINGKSHKLPELAPDPSSYVSIGTQCDWKVETPEMNSCNILSVNEKKEARITVINQDNLLIEDKNSEVSMVLRGWSPHINSNPTSDQKVLVPTTFSQQFACNIQTLPFDEKFFLQFDYKTRNKLKTKQRRLDPYYRSQERVRQRTVMRIKRQDPRFRAAEREKGRYRMRIKRLDPVFRSQERERQRERMKIKRSDPGFREKEREQQKTRLHVKRLDPAFKEKERAQDRIRMHIKRQNNGLYSSMHSNKTKSNSREECIPCTENMTLKSNNDSCDIDELQSNQAAFPDNINSRILSVKPKDSAMEAFHFKKQHILNFNFYNTNKEQWAVHDELCSKTIAHFNVLGSPSITEDTISILRRDHVAFSRKSNINTEVNSHELLDVKPVEMCILEAPKSNAVNSNSTSLDRISLMPSPGGIIPIHEDTISLKKDPSLISKKADINTEANSQTMMSIKPVEMPLLEASKEKIINSDSSSINRISLTSGTGGLTPIHEDTMNLLRKDPLLISKKADINTETNSQITTSMKPVEMPLLEASKEKIVNSDSSSVNRISLTSGTGSQFY